MENVKWAMILSFYYYSIIHLYNNAFFPPQSSGCNFQKQGNYSIRK